MRIELGYNGKEGKLLRDHKAQELRQDGYTVICKKWDFADLARGVRYTLVATKEGQT